MRHHLQPLALAVCAVLGLALAPAAQAGTITEGDPLIPPGLVVGNTFRLAFITSTTHNGLSADIGVYNTFVTTLANGTGSLVKDRGWVWKAMASTTTVDAGDNLGLGSITGYPLYRLDNFKLADSYTDFLTHFPPFHQQPNGDGSLFVDEKGIAHGDQQVFTGTATYFTSTPALNWVKYDDDPDGGPLGSLSGKTNTGKSVGEGGNWSTDGGQALSSLKYFYAMSEPLEIVASAPSDPYVTWAGAGVAFDADANNDGVDNGMAWLLGAADPSENAVGKMPAASRSGTNLRLTFRCLKSTKRGGRVLKVQSSSDLGASDPWINHDAAVPDADSTVNGVVFDTTDDGDFINVIAEIPAAGTKLFGRLQAAP